jgi:hypothetical protein
MMNKVEKSIKNRDKGGGGAIMPIHLWNVTQRLSYTCHDIREYLNTTLQLLRLFDGMNMNIVGLHHVQFFNYCSHYFNNL